MIFTMLSRKKKPISVKRKWLTEFECVHMLRDAGCFDPRTAPQSEQFAELMASVEGKIRLQASGVAQ